MEELLIQHRLTERLIGTIFDKPEFVQQNDIAAEVDKDGDGARQPKLQPLRPQLSHRL